MRKLTFLFALLCVSVMGWAVPVEGSSTENMDGQPGFTNGYDYSFSTEGTSVNISFTEKENYGGLMAYLWNYTSGFAETEMTVSGHTASITLTGQTPGATLDFACKFAFSGGMSVTKRFTYTVEDTGSGSDPGSDPEPARASECFGAKGHFGNPSVKNVYYQIDYEDNKAIINLISLTGYPLDFAEVHIAGVGNYAMTANGVGGYSYTINNPTVDAEWYLRFLYSDTNMPGNEMTSENVNSSDPNIIYYVVGSCTSTVTENENIALSSAGSSATASTGNGSLAIDGNIGGASRWESASEDPQWICVNFGERKKFNMVQLVHEGAYIKTYDIQVSDDGTNFTTIKHVSETLDGFPYEQSIDLGFDYAAQYMRIYGTERGTGYGYSLWELRAMYSGASTLTSITLTAADNKTLVGGAGVVLTATPKDQKGLPMEETVEYEITPAAAGHMDGNTFIPDQAGMASIVAFNGAIRSAAVQVLGVTSANLALSTNIVTDNKIIAQSEFTPNGTDAFSAVDGNMGSVWQGSPTNGNVDDSREYDCWFVVDLGAFYNIDLVALHFEGACSELYHIDFSANNSDWNLGYNLVGAEGINARNDYWTDLDNNTKVRYVRFWSTKAATGWGMKLFEFEVYGTEWSSGDEEKPVMVSASLVSSTVNSAVIAVSATDNDEVARFHVVDATNGIDANFTPSEGKITINGLTHATDYNFTITAKDASNNESENSMVVAVSTPFDGSINLALNQPCEGGYYDNNPAESADKANDGNNGTSWVTYGDHAAALDWWIVDLGKVYNLTNITALWANDAYATQYMLQARVDAPTNEDKADDAAWVTLETVSGVTAGEERSTNVSGVGRYVRFRATAFAGGFFRLREFRVYASGVAEVDAEKPVMSSASLVSNTDSRAIIAVSATDNQGIAKYRVVDATKGIDAYFAAEAGNITVTGLAGGTSYNFTITAIDFFGNESANSKSVEVATVAHLTAPTAAAPAPTWPAEQVMSIYSNAYAPKAAWGFLEGWKQTTGKEDIEISEDNIMRYYNFNYLGWATATPYNVLTMEKLHLDIWVENNCQIGIVPIYGTPGNTLDDNQRKIVSLTGQQWNSIDLTLATDYPALNLSSIYQFKFDNGSMTEFWIDNVYFYRTTAPAVDEEAPTAVSAIVSEESFYSAKLIVQATDESGAVSFSVKNGDTEIATGAAASGVETTITINGLTAGTRYNLTIVASDGTNEAEPVAVVVNTKILPPAAPVPTNRAEDVKSLYSDVYTPAAPLENTCENWWQAPTNTELVLAGSDHLLLYDNIPATSTFGWAFGDSKVDAEDFQILHVSIYPLNTGTIEIYPVREDGPEYHSISLTLIANQWNEVVLDFSDKDLSKVIKQLGFTNYSSLGSFFVDNVYFSRPIAKSNVDKWATFACAGPVNIPSGVTAYWAEYSNEGGDEILNLHEISDVIPANTGVLLKGAEASNIYAFTKAETNPDAIAENSLVGCPNRTDISAVAATNDIFCLRRSDLFEMSAFFLYEGQYIPAGKAYLALAKPVSPSSAPRRIRFVFNEEQTATDVENVGVNTEITKFIENGQLFIRRGDAIYTVQGIRVK